MPRDAASSTSAPTEPAPAETDWSADIAANWRGSPDDEEDGDRSFATPATPTLRDHLLSQLTLTNLDERDRAFVMVLIDALDEDGYLTQPLEEIAALLPAEAEVEIEELTIALRHLQHLEPAGVGARSPGRMPVPAAANPARRRGAAPRPGHRRQAPRSPREPRLHAPQEH